MTKRKPPSKLKKRGRKSTAPTPQQVESASRRLEALRLRQDGYSYADIGAWLDPPVTGKRARELVLDAMAEMKADTTETAEEVRALELARLDSMTPKPLEAARNGDTRAIDAVIKIMDRRAAIIGLDAPKKQELSGPNGAPIPIARVERVIVYPAGHAPQRRPADAGAATGGEIPDGSMGNPATPA